MKGSTAQRSRFFWIEVGLLIALAAVGLYVWFQNRGLSEEALKSASLIELEQITRSHPNSPRPFYYLGKQHEKAQDLSAAYDAYTHSADLNPDDPETWMAAARLAAQLHGDKGAIGILDIFLKRHPDNAEAHLARARLYLQRPSYEGALNDAVAVTHLDPKNPEAWYIVGLAANTIGSGVAAVDALGQAVTLAPSNWHYATVLAETLAVAKKYEEAIALARKTAQQNPNEPVPALTLGKLQLMLARTPEAIAEAQTSLRESARTGSNIPMVWQLLARSYAAQNRWPEAKDAIIRAGSLNPTDPLIALEAVRIARRSNDTVLATQALASYRQLRNAAPPP